jgi:putative phosphoribosyl transferase
MSFRNRFEAGRKLALRLKRYKDQQPVILALPRGGVPVAAEVAAALDAPLDLVLVRKIGVPSQPELAMGAVVDGGSPIVIRNEDVIRLAGVDEAEFQAVCDSELAEIERRRQRYLGGRERADVKRRLAIVIDDGIATGATTRAALRATRMREPKKLVLAVPVAPTDTLAAMQEEADEVICLEDHEIFGAIGYFYDDFRQMTDQEVTDILARFTMQGSAKSQHPAQ